MRFSLYSSTFLVFTLLTLSTMHILTPLHRHLWHSSKAVCTHLRGLLKNSRYCTMKLGYSRPPIQSCQYASPAWELQPAARQKQQYQKQGFAYLHFWRLLLTEPAGLASHTETRNQRILSITEEKRGNCGQLATSGFYITTKAVV